MSQNGQRLAGIRRVSAEIIDAGCETVLYRLQSDLLCPIVSPKGQMARMEAAGRKNNLAPVWKQGRIYRAECSRSSTNYSRRACISWFDSFVHIDEDWFAPKKRTRKRTSCKMTAAKFTDFQGFFRGSNFTENGKTNKTNKPLKRQYLYVYIKVLQSAGLRSYCVIILYDLSILYSALFVLFIFFSTPPLGKIN